MRFFAGMFGATVLLLNLAAVPASMPATTQASRPKPMHMALRYAIAMAGGNADEVRKYFFATTPQEQELAGAYAGLASSVQRLQANAHEKFGEHGFELIGFGKMFNEEIAGIRSAKVTENGNQAQVFNAGVDKPPLALVFVNGDWKISVAESFKKNPERRIARIHAQSGAFNELAAEIKKGMYPDAAAAREGGREKVAKAMAAVEAEFGKTSTTQGARP